MANPALQTIEALQIPLFEHPGAPHDYRKNFDPRVGLAYALGSAKTTVIRPVLIDREIPKLQARLDELTKLTPSGGKLPAPNDKEFIEVTNQLKLLTDRRALLLIRTGDDYVIDPPKLPAKP